VLAARRASEGASRAAIEGIGVFSERRPDHLDAGQAALRNGLRAKWRQLGGDRELLVAECAYEQWHRLLFARFLAENGLLLHPQYKAPVTLAECEELAAELGEPDGWSVAARFAAEILPGIFRLDDPCVQLRLAPEGRHALEQILDGLPADVFPADDALGWVYQFWQKDKKDEVNASERKIGGADLGPVTQLFTENYMVRFLLENSLGAWWAARHPDSSLVKSLEYLRFDDDGSPAAGSFDGWPDRAAQVTVMDPCCGSGHFLVEAFLMLWQMRAEEEDLSPVVAQDAVLRDNLFGLELDPRCVQIAMFNVALQAWKAGRGWRQLPVPNIACSGIPVKAPVDEWKALANGDQRLEEALVRLHGLFREADTLGSLIDPQAATEIRDPTRQQTSLEDVDWHTIEPLLARAAGMEQSDPATAVLGADAAKISRAADYLSRLYTLVATNVPYLGRGSQAKGLRDLSVAHYALGEADLATTMVERLKAVGNTLALVVPSNWLFRKSFEEFRRHWLGAGWHSLVRLGPGAFRSISGEVVQAVLWTVSPGPAGDCYVEIDLSDAAPDVKPRLITESLLQYASRERQRANPESVVQAAASEVGLARLGDLVDARAGISTGDTERFVRWCWEVPTLGGDWMQLQRAPASSEPCSGRSLAIYWQDERGELARWAGSLKHLNHAAQKWRRGKPLWGHRGVAVRLMGTMNTAFYDGAMFDHSVVVVVPNDPADLAAVWAFATSGTLERAVRSFHSGISIESGTLLSVQLDIDHWRAVGRTTGSPDVLTCDDPAQWLFEGRPEASTAPLQVAVARLIGYRWPEQSESDDLDVFADADGIVCLPAVAGEAPAAERLQQVLGAAFGDAWSPAQAQVLLEQSGSKKKNLSDWLRDEFFKQHCALFGNRPFIWQVWDGERDGFSALLNYHRLDRKTLEKLTYTYLGQDWVERQRAEARDDVAGAEARLGAALELQRKLEEILEGEAPFDVYVRWKSLHEQSVGWEPDLNDGVRFNIRPFVEAGVLRSPFNIHWKKDRGKNLDGSERHNDIQLTLAQKLDARKQAGSA
jgi:hypothetical protein